MSKSYPDHSYWYTSPALWDKLKPLARENRREPTLAEKRLWQQLRNRQIAGVKFRRQYTIERFIVDFIAVKAKLVVEVDGPYHQYAPDEDLIRQEYLESLGLQVLRFSNDDVMTNLEGVVAWIAETIQTADGDDGSKDRSTDV